MDVADCKRHKALLIAGLLQDASITWIDIHSESPATNDKARIKPLPLV